MARHAVEHKPWPALDKFILLNPRAEDHLAPFVKIFDTSTMEYELVIPTVDQLKMISIVKAWSADVIKRYNMVQYTWYENQGCKHCFSIGPGLKPNEITIQNTVLIDYFAATSGIRTVYPRLELGAPTSLVRIKA